MNDEQAAALARELKSGDLVLFNRRCHTMSPMGALLCFSAKHFLRSPWDHIGMVVVREDGQPLVLEATLSGVVARPFLDRVNKSSSYDIAVRRLQLPPSEYAVRSQQLNEWADEIMGSPYPSLPDIVQGTLFTQSRKQRDRVMRLLVLKQQQHDSLQAQHAHAGPVAKRLLEAQLRDMDADMAQLQAMLDATAPSIFDKPASKAAYCSELVAAGYQRMGLLPPLPSSKQYAPKDFSSSSPLFLLHGASLRREEFVRQHKATTLVPSPEPSTSSEKELIGAALRKNMVTSSLPPECRSALVGAFRKQVFQPGEYIVMEGEQGDTFYVIDSGQCEVESTLAGRYLSHKVATLLSGCAFGEQGFFFQQPRSASVKAVTEVSVWAMDTRTFTSLTQPFRQSLQDAGSTAHHTLWLQRVLAQNPLFAPLMQDEVQERKLISSFFKMEVKAGERIVHKDTPSENIYLIQSGGVSWNEQHALTGTTTRIDYGPDQCFGDVELLYDIPRAGTAVATKDSVVWALNRHAFSRLLQRGSLHVQQVFNEYASVELWNGKRFMTHKDFVQLLQRLQLTDGSEKSFDIALAVADPFGRQSITLSDFALFDYTLNSANALEQVLHRVMDPEKTGTVSLARFSSALALLAPFSASHYAGVASGSLFSGVDRVGMGQALLWLEQHPGLWVDLKAGVGTLNPRPFNPDAASSVVVSDAVARMMRQSEHPVQAIVLAGAAMACRVLVAPFELATILSQAAPQRVRLLSHLRLIASTHGFTALFRGTTAAVAHAAVFGSCYLSLFRLAHARLQSESLAWMDISAEGLNAFAATGSLLVAGVLAYPLSSLRTVSALTLQYPPPPTSHLLLSARSLPLLFSGLGISFLHAVPFLWTSFLTYEVTLSLVSRHSSESMLQDPGGWVVWGSGAVAAVACKTLVHPLDTLRRRKQTRQWARAGFVDPALLQASARSVRRLWRGWVPMCLGMVVGVGVSNWVYSEGVEAAASVGAHIPNRVVTMKHNVMVSAMR